jgi:hypothetical protein
MAKGFSGMSGLRFECDWEDPKGVLVPELRSTWARLTIFVNETPVTQVYDHGANSVRNGIYLPLYPLAEWLAINWWTVFHELEVSRRPISAVPAQTQPSVFAGRLCVSKPAENPIGKDGRVMGSLRCSRLRR